MKTKLNRLVIIINDKQDDLSLALSTQEAFGNCLKIIEMTCNTN